MKKASNRYQNSRTFPGHCEACQKKICMDCAFSYVDEASAAISYHAQYLCRACYHKKYPGRHLTPELAYRQHLAERLHHMANLCFEDYISNQELLLRLSKAILADEV